MTQQIAFLGLGTMGSPMTVNLVKSGFRVKAWNRTPNRLGVETARKAGVTVVSSIQEAVEDADIIGTCVGDVPDVEAVLLGEEGVVKFARSGALIIDFTTIGTKAAVNIAHELQKHHLRFMDAPISGGDIGAQNGTLTIMVGGESTDFAEAKPILEAMGKTIVLCGAVGSGQSVKMCNQALCAVHMVALCEAIMMAQKQGIDPNLMIEVCSTGAAGSWALSHLASKAAASDFAPGFMIKHILKDLRLVQESASETLPGVTLANRLFKKVSELENGAEQGTQAMLRAYRRGDFS